MPCFLAVIPASSPTLWTDETPDSASWKWFKTKPFLELLFHAYAKQHFKWMIGLWVRQSSRGRHVGELRQEDSV